MPSDPYSPLAYASVPPSRRHRGRVAAVVGGVAVLAIGLFGAGAAWSVWSGLGSTDTAVRQEAGTSGLQGQDSGSDRGQGSGPDSGAGQQGAGPQRLPGLGSDDDPNGAAPGGTAPDSTTSGTVASATAATAAQQVGLVTIVTTLGYEHAQAAGTGMILTSDGEILTNNHVIDGATSIEVTVESTGTTYAASVVGTDPTADVAVLSLAHASGLATVTLDRSAVTAGQAVTAIGNAEGGGDLLAAAGTVTAVKQSITTQSEGITSGQSLKDLIAFSADVVSGDSGGAVLNSSGEVVGMTTAASSGTSDVSGYAIPVADALAVVKQIDAGQESETVTIGYPAFLGVQLGTARASAVAGAVVGGVFDGTPAADAGIARGDVITAIDSTAVASGDALSVLLAGHAPGDTVTVSWTTAAGASQSADVTLIAGPAN